jgi:hypothetical protein
MKMSKTEHISPNSMHTISLMFIDIIRIKLSSLNLIEYSAKTVFKHDCALMLNVMQWTHDTLHN